MEVRAHVRVLRPGLQEHPPGLCGGEQLLPDQVGVALAFAHAKPLANPLAHEKSLTHENSFAHEDSLALGVGHD